MTLSASHPRPFPSPELTGCVPGTAHVPKGELIIAQLGLVIGKSQTQPDDGGEGSQA